MTRRSWSTALAAALSLSLTGCATTLAVLPRHSVLTSEQEVRTPLGPRSERLRSARVSLADRAVLCDAEVRHPRERVDSWRAGYDAGGRLGIGFIGVSEVGLGGFAAWAGATDENRTAGSWVVAGLGALLAIDGVASVILAFALADFEEQRSVEVDGTWQAVAGCPAGSELWIGSLRVPVDEAGRLPLPDAGDAWSSATRLSVRLGDETRTLALAPETRCAIATSMGVSVPECAPPAEPAAAPPSPPVTAHSEVDLRLELEVGATAR